MIFDAEFVDPQTHAGAGATAVSPGDGGSPSSSTTVYVTLGAAAAVGLGGLLLGGVVGWALRGSRNEKRLSSKARRELSED